MNFTFVVPGSYIASDCRFLHPIFSYQTNKKTPLLLPIVTSYETLQDSLSDQYIFIVFQKRWATQIFNGYICKLLSPLQHTLCSRLTRKNLLKTGTSLFLTDAWLLVEVRYKNKCLHCINQQKAL